MPAVEPVGGQRGVAREHSPPSSRGGRLPVQVPLPGREEGEGRILGNAGVTPPTAEAFAIRLDFCDSPSRGE